MSDLFRRDEILAESDVRSLVRLLGEVAAARGDHQEKKRLLMDGLCRLIDADFWAWALCEPAPAGETAAYSHFQHGGFSPERYARYRAAIDHPRVGEIIIPLEAELESKRTHLTRTMEQFDPSDLIHRSEVGGLFDAAGIGPIMLSMRPLAGGARSGIGLYRHEGRPHFGPREARIAHIVLTEVPWLHFQSWTDGATPAIAEAPRLTRSEQAVMEHLAEGHGRKEIAARLRLSEHTVNDYVKIVYRHFGVNSQAKLISRLSRGDGGDKIQ
jgi:DNA-binding CsgD family transcriptional regulator